MTKNIFLADSKATEQLGYLLGELVLPGTVILLSGDLGAGKTTLIQGMGKGLGILEPIVSPTFTLINEYTEGRIPLYHLDLYRLSPEQVPTIHPEIYWEAEEIEAGITAIEWSERLPYKPEEYIDIQLIYTSEVSRQANLKLVGNSKQLSVITSSVISYQG
jgi:tRNA threonylcarbamoyladenosine biosynthesis protein TsaE